MGRSFLAYAMFAPSTAARTWASALPRASGATGAWTSHDRTTATRDRCTRTSLGSLAMLYPARVRRRILAVSIPVGACAALLGLVLPAAAQEEVGGPRPADPWSILRDVPGVVVDRVNVGGSESEQQSLLVSHGDSGLGATYTVDGVD